MEKRRIIGGCIVLAGVAACIVVGFTLDWFMGFIALAIGVVCGVVVMDW